MLRLHITLICKVFTQYYNYRTKTKCDWFQQQSYRMSNRIDLTFRISGGAQTWSPCADSEMMTNADVDHDDERSVDDGEHHLREDGVMYDAL